MPTTTYHGAPICLRCGTRADARRGPSAVCLSCGTPLPAAGSASSSSSSAIYWILGVIALIGVTLLGGVALFFLSGRDAGSSSGHTTVTIVTETASSTASTPSASSSANARNTAPLTDAERDTLEGNYTCSMDDTPNFPCRISNGVLEKLAGSQRFKGPASKLSNGNITFSGTFFCPFGDCTHPVATTFVRQGPGHYAGKFGPNSVPGGGPGGEHVVLVKVR